MAGQAVQSLEGLLAISVTEHAHEDLGGPEVARDLDRRHRHHPGNARILRLLVEKARNFHPDRLSKAIGATILSHESLGCCGAKGPGEFLGAVALDDVAGLEVVVVLD